MSRGVKSTEAVFPTLKNIESWENECVRIDADIKGLHARKAALISMIQGAKVFLPPEVLSTEKGANRRIKKAKKVSKKASPSLLKTEKTPQKKEARKGAGTWTATIQGILEKAGRGLTYEELKAEIAKTELGETLQKTDKSFYGAIARLADAGHLVRHKGRLFAAAAFEQFMKDVAAGRALDTLAPLAGHRSPMSDAVKEFLKTREFGAISGEIVQQLMKNPEFAPTLKKNKTHIYNILSRLKSREEISKKGERYLLARRENGGVFN